MPIGNILPVNLSRRDSHKARIALPHDYPNSRHRARDDDPNHRANRIIFHRPPLYAFAVVCAPLRNAGETRERYRINVSRSGFPSLRLRLSPAPRLATFYMAAIGFKKGSAEGAVTINGGKDLTIQIFIGP
jgi:hypothetical protein